jgi:hypothetical protein
LCYVTWDLLHTRVEDAKEIAAKAGLQTYTCRYTHTLVGNSVMAAVVSRMSSLKTLS